jgi:hypothetical protein
MSKPKKINPHCPVAGCKTTAPHLSEPTQKELHDIFAKPTTTAEWVKHCIAEIIDSSVDDLKRQPDPRFLAFVLRWRQAHEMYIREHWLYICLTPSVSYPAALNRFKSPDTGFHKYDGNDL